MSKQTGKNVCFICGWDITDENIGARYPKRNGIDVYKCSRCYDEEPLLKQPTQCYSRIVGYLAPINQWNKGKKSEYARRKIYKSEFKEK